jgi:hypothetical protein
LHRKATRDLAHRRQQRQRAVGELDRLVGDGTHAPRHQQARQLLVGGEMQIREEDELGAQVTILRRARLLDLDDELGAPGVVGVDETGAGGDVGRIVDAAAVTGAVLDEDFVAVCAQRGDAARREGDTVLVRLALLRHADAHAVMLAVSGDFTKAECHI